MQENKDLYTNSGKLDLIVTPIFGIGLFIMMIAVWSYSDFDNTTADILSSEKLISQIVETLFIGVSSSFLVVITAIPIGIGVTRSSSEKLKNYLISTLGLGQALPAYGLLVVFFIFMGQGAVTVIFALAFFTLLPVLRNTIVGLEQVDKSVIEAGRGMGYSNLQTLLKIELPLAVPIIVAGIRTSVVINIGMAALAFIIGGGGLGETINSGLKLNRSVAIFIGASLVALLALVFDFIGAVSQRYLKPKGL